MPDADEELLHRAESGDHTAFDRLLERHLPALRAYVRLNIPADVRSRESCSDLVQSVCREVWVARGQFEYRSAEAFRAWLFHWALHKIRDRAKYHRADKRAVRHETDRDGGPDAAVAALYASISTPSAAAIAHEHVVLLERAFEMLDDEDRQVITLCRIVGLPREEVGRLRGTSPGAVRTHLGRALVRLSRALQKLGVEPD